MSHRWTIDYPEDYRFLCEVYDALCSDTQKIFGVDEVLAFLEERLEIAAINAHLAGINWYRNHLDELKMVDGSRTREELGVRS
jgi:spore coat polysaccharide biosynthesis protein SpsF